MTIKPADNVYRLLDRDLPRQERKLRNWKSPYLFSLVALGAFILFAFCIDTPEQIGSGFLRILLSRSLLNTDYIEVGGIGAAFLNVALTGILSVLMFLAVRAKPTGGHLMAIWMTVSFGFFGKNLLNGLPIHLGTWLYARYKKEPFGKYALNAVLAATLSPVVSELAFMGWLGQPWDGLIGAGAGVGVGFCRLCLAKVRSGYVPVIRPPCQCHCMGGGVAKRPGRITCVQFSGSPPAKRAGIEGRHYLYGSGHVYARL